MVRFSYTAIDSQRGAQTAHLEAASRAEALEQLRQKGLFAVDLQEQRGLTNQGPRLGKGGVTRFYSMLSDQLEVGVPLLKAIDVIRSQEKSVGSRHLLDAISRQLASGVSLSQALSSYPDQFPQIDISLIRAGEEGGFLSQALSRVTQVREWQATLASNLWGALAYPLILVTVAALLIPGMLIFLVPKFEPLFDSLRQVGRMPWPTTMLLAVSRYSQDYGVVTFVGLLGLLLLGYWSIPEARRVLWRDRILFRLPLVGPLLRDLDLARFCRVLGTLLENKISILKAFDISAKVVSNRMLSQSIDLAQLAVGAGKTLVEPFSKSEFVPVEVIAMIGVGEQSNTLDSVLLKIATQLENRSRKRLEFGVKLLEPLLLLVMALVVGFIVLALLLPVFEGQGLT